MNFPAIFLLDGFLLGFCKSPSWDIAKRAGGPKQRAHSWSSKEFWSSLEKVRPDGGNRRAFMTNSELRSSVAILLWSCNKICTLSCQLSKSLSDSKEAAGRSEQSQHHSQLGHSGTSAEPLHPDVSGTTAGVFVCLSSLKLNKEENVILSIVFILPFPTAAFPPAAEFADGPKPHSLCRPGYRWSPSAPLVLSSTHCFEVVSPPCCRRTETDLWDCTSQRGRWRFWEAYPHSGSSTGGK